MSNKRVSKYAKNILKIFISTYDCTLFDYAIFFCIIYSSNIAYGPSN